MTEIFMVEECIRGSNFGGHVVPHSLFYERIQKEPRVKCAEKLGEATIVFLHNFGIVGQFVPQIATWKGEKGGKH